MHTWSPFSSGRKIIENNVYVFSDVVVIDPLTHQTHSLKRNFRLEMPYDPTDEEAEERIQDYIKHNIFLPKKLRLPVVAFNCTRENPHEELAAGCY